MRVGVIQLSAAGEADNHEIKIVPDIGFSVDCNWAETGCFAIYHSVQRGLLNIVPELNDSRVRLPPAPHNVRKLFFCQTAPQCAHAFQRFRSALIAECQRRHLPLDSVDILRVPLCYALYGNAEHLGRRRLVNFAVAPEYVQHPFLARKPGQNTGFNRAEIRVYEHTSRRRDEHRPDKSGKGVRDAAVAYPQSVRLPVLHQLPGETLTAYGIMRKVLQLYQVA